MFVIANNSNNETSTTTTMLVDTNIIMSAIRSFLIKKNARLEVFWPQLCYLEQQYLPSNLPMPDIELLAQREIMFICCQ